MTISNSFFFLSLFNPDSSGTMSFNFRNIKVELDVKHSEYDWGEVPLSLLNFEYYPKTIVIYNWIPIRWKCQGIRINIFLRKESDN